MNESPEEIREVKKRRNEQLKNEEINEETVQDNIKRFDKTYKLMNYVNDRAFNEAFKDKDDLFNFLKLLIICYEKKQDIYKEIRSKFLKKNTERSEKFCKWKNDIFDMSQRNVDIDIFKFKRILDDLEYDI